MEHAIRGFASWQLSSVPRFLATEDVERVISSCTDYVFGLRDRAVLLLLARLGLRASEVAQLKFTDIDWRNGAITVCGKGRRQESLPLPQEVGNAMLLYLSQGRPPLRVPEVFTTVLAPLRPLTRAGVTHIVRGVHYVGLESKRPSTALTFCGTQPLRPCSVKVHLWPASVRFCDTALP
jgi:site-specific recombinase XerD